MSKLTPEQLKKLDSGELERELIESSADNGLGSLDQAGVLKLLSNLAYLRKARAEDRRKAAVAQAASDEDTPRNVRVRKMSKATALAVSIGDEPVTALPFLASANTAEDMRAAETEIQARLARAISSGDEENKKYYAAGLVKIRMMKTGRYFKADDKSVSATVEAIASADLPCYVDRNKMILDFVSAALPGIPASLGNHGILQEDSPSGSDQWDKITREILGEHYPRVFPGSDPADNSGVTTELNLNLTGEKTVVTGFEKRHASREGRNQTDIDEEQRAQRLAFARSTSIPTKKIFGVN